LERFAAGPQCPRKAEEPGRHLFVVEFARSLDEERIGIFAAKLDQGLSARNSSTGLQL
jgi:hypothetical protein